MLDFVSDDQVRRAEGAGVDMDDDDVGVGLTPPWAIFLASAIGLLVVGMALAGFLFLLKYAGGVIDV